MNFPAQIGRLTSVAALALALALSGCAAQQASGTATSSGTAAATESSTATVPISAELAASIADDTHFDEDDLSWDAADETRVSLADGSSSAEGAGSSAVKVDGDTITISAAGTYRLSGSLTDGQVVVAAGEEDVVRILLDDAAVTSGTGAPFVVQSANEVLVYLEDGTANTLTDAKTYADSSEDAPNAALYSMADLTIAGPGKLAVTGNYADGIVSKDGLVLASGTVTVEAADDGIKGKDYLALLGGSWKVTAGRDGVKSDNEEDADRGWLLAAGGALTVAAGDDGVKAYDTLTVTDGKVTVTKSEEGLEAQHIAVKGGKVTVTSNDDGVNASGSAGTTDQGGGFGMPGGGEQVGDYTVKVSGGSLTINAEGDGLDSNGTAAVTGGTVVVNGPSGEGNGALDVNGDLTVDGGTVAAAGSAGMAGTPSASSSQSGVQVTFGSSLPAGTAVQIADSSGDVVATFVTAKAAASLVLSAADITAGKQYTVYTGGTADVEEGLGTGTLDGASEVGTVTAGEYTASNGPGGH